LVSLVAQEAAAAALDVVPTTVPFKTTTHKLTQNNRSNFVQSRYIGSDSLLKRQQEATSELTSANLGASERIGKAVESNTAAIVGGQRQLSQLSAAQAQAEAEAAASNVGIAGFAKAVGGAVVAYKKQDDESKAEAARLAAAQAKAAEEAKAEQLKRVRAENKVKAAEAIAAIDIEYGNSNWEAGVGNYKTATAKVLASYDLEPADLGELFTKVNSRAVGRSDDVGKRIVEGVEKTQRLQSEKGGLELVMALSADIGVIKNLPPTEQSRPYLENIEAKLLSFMKLDNGMTFDQKLEAVMQVQKQLLPAVAAKGEAYGEFVTGMKAREEWVRVHNTLNAQLASGQIGLAEYKSQKAALAIRTGVDLDKYTTSPGDDEKAQLEILNVVKGINDINQSARENLGKTFDLGDSASQTIAAGIIVNPNLRFQLENDPYLKDSPYVKSGVELAKKVAALEADLGGLGVDRAEANKQLQQLNLSNVRNVAELTRSIARKTKSGEQLNNSELLAQVQLQQLAAVSPGVAEYISKQVQSGGTATDTAAEIQALQKTLTDEATSIENVKRTVLEQYNAQYDSVLAKHNEVITLFGGVPTKAKLAEFYKTGMPGLQQKLQQFQQEIQSTGASALPAFGQQPNFNSAGGEAGVIRQHSGSYSVAPKTKLQVQSNKGQPFITPVEAGVNAPHSFNTGENGGGYKAGRRNRNGGKRQHAGIDFPLSGGQKAMTVVSGTVQHVGTASGYGGFVDVLGDNGKVYRYAHISPYVRKGQRLSAGEAVATPNGSGVGGHHLHFEVWDSKRYFAMIDPKTGIGAWGIDGTLDPVTHLRELTQKAGTQVGSTTTVARGQGFGAVRAFAPAAKTNLQTFFVAGAGALQGNLFQQVGKPVQQTRQVFGNQRPLNTSSARVPYNAVQAHQRNLNDDLGYAFLRNSPPLMQQIHRTAASLGVPAIWIADIAAQESGAGALAMKIHPGSKDQNFGLFGFGNNSGVRNWLSLSPVQQVVAYEKYMKDNGWLKVKERYGAAANVGQFWAITRMGVTGSNWRKQIIDGRDPESLKLNDTGRTYADELRMLGNHVGREYDVPSGTRSSRASRNRGVRRSKRASTLTHTLADNNSYELLTRDT
jgi:Peptidase family M23